MYYALGFAWVFFSISFILFLILLFLTANRNERRVRRRRMQISFVLAVVCFIAMIIVGTIQLESDNSTPAVAETAADKSKDEEQKKKEEKRKKDAVLYKAYKKKILDFSKGAFESSATFTTFETDFLNNPQATLEGYQYVESYKEVILSYRDFLWQQQVPEDLSEDVRVLLIDSKENMMDGITMELTALNSLLEYFDSL